MPTRFFSGKKSEILPEIEKFRELQAFCSHDLRSQVGAVAGLLQLLEDPLSSLDDKTKTSYGAALTSAQEALANLDANVADAKPNFETVWLIGFTSSDMVAMHFGETFEGGGSPRLKPILLLNFTNPEEWQPRVKKYRPLAVFFKNRSALSATSTADAATWINRLGPQLTKIFILDGAQGPLEGVRPEAVTLLNASADLPSVAQQILEAVESLPHGRK